MIIVLVKLPLTAIDEHLIPCFRPSLKNKEKYWGDRWIDNLPDVDDPAEKFALVTKVIVVPEQAKTFVHTIISSSNQYNTTRIFFIKENDSREKTGNVSIFV